MKKNSKMVLSLLLFAATGCLVWRIAIAGIPESAMVMAPSVSSQTAAQTQDENFFEAFRTSREVSRAQTNQYLTQLIESDDSTYTAKREAEDEKIQLAKNIENEFLIEYALIAKGFSDAAVTISASGVNVVVQAETLSQQDTTVILDVVCRQLSCPASSVYIVANP